MNSPLANDTSKWRESDLYQPVKAFLEAQGYTVRGEVGHCDVVAVPRVADSASEPGDVVIVELKLNFSIAVLAQAVARQSLTNLVYIAVPRPKTRLNSAKWKGMRRVLKRLELGLLFVTLGKGGGQVQIVEQPIPYQQPKNAKARKGLLQEFHSRSGDYNQGGTTRRKLVTAYREQAIEIAFHLDKAESLAPRELRQLGTCERTRSILYDNVYGWFLRLGRGQYAISEAGREAVRETYRDIADTVAAAAEENLAPDAKNPS